MPPIAGGHEYLIGILFEIGPTASSGMGEGPISFQEILAYQITTGVRLTHWEARMLRRLSVDYMSEVHRAEMRDAKAPWQSSDLKPVVTDTQAALRALAKL